MQLLNHKVIFSQLDKLLDHVAKQISLSADPWLQEIPFDAALFSTPHRKLSLYLTECRLTLSRIQQYPPDETRLLWQVEHLTEQCQALLKALNTLPKRAPHLAPSRSEELQGYARRLMEKEALLQCQLSLTESFTEQQRLLRELEITQQRLSRCQLAQTEHHWKKMFSTSP